MATEVQRRTVICPLVLPKGDPPAPIPQPHHSTNFCLGAVTHTLLNVLRAESPPLTPAPIKVQVYNASDNRMVHLDLDRSDTVGKVKALFHLERPDLSPNLQLACNGKPVLDHQTLGMLNLKETAMFITFQKCNGG